jgi:hypothetical protein
MAPAIGAGLLFLRRLQTLDANLAQALLFTLSCVFVPLPLYAALDAAPIRSG